MYNGANPAWFCDFSLALPSSLTSSETHRALGTEGRHSLKDNREKRALRGWMRVSLPERVIHLVLGGEKGKVKRGRTGSRIRCQI